MADMFSYLAALGLQTQNDLLAQIGRDVTTIRRNTTATFVYADQSAIWGQDIPVSWGHVILKAPVMQLGPLKGEFGERFNDWGMLFDGGDGFAWGYDVRTVFRMDIACALGYNGDTTKSRTVRKIWVDGLLAYDYSQPNLNQLKFAFFPQSETTQPFQGFYLEFDEVVAYRGLQYIVLLDFLVFDSKLNIRRTKLPEVKVEFWDYTVPANAATVYDPLGTWSGGIDGDSTFYDSRAQKIYSFDTTNTIHVFDTKSQSEIARYDFTDPDDLFTVDINVGESDDACLVRGWEPTQVFLTFESGLNNGNEIGIVDLTTGEVIDHFGAQAIFPTNTFADNRIRNQNAHFPFYSGLAGYRRSFVLMCTAVNGYYIWKICDELEGIAGQFEYVSAGENVANPILHISEEGIALESGGTKHLVVYGGGSTNQYGFLTIDKDGRFSFGALGTPPNEAATTWSATFLTADNCFVVFETVSGTRKIKKLNGSDGALLKTVDTGFNWPTPNQLWQQSETNGRGLGWVINTGSNRYVQRLDFLTMTITQHSIGSYSWSNQLLYDAMTNSFYNPNATDGINELNVAPITAGSVTLSSILQGLCVAKGYSLSDVTVTGVDDVVIGAIIPHRFDLDKTLKDLAAVYGFSYINRDGKVIITRATRGSGFSATWDVYAADRIPYEEDDNLNGVTVKTKRMTDTKVPSKTELTFIDYNFNYQPSTYTYQRPDNTTNSEASQSYTIPIVMDQDTAAALVTRMTYDSWASRTEHEFKVGKKFLAMEPGDTVNIHRSGYIDVAKVKEVTIGVNFELEVRAEGMNTIAGPVIVTDPYEDVVNPTMPGDGLTELLVLDTTAIETIDTQGDEKSAMYFATVPAGRGAFAGAAVFRADSTTSPYSKFLESQAEPLWGRMTEVLTDEYWLGIDRLYELELQVYGGDTSQLVTVTTDEMLDGANRLLVGDKGRWELIGFETVEWRSGRLYISGILRGLRGTDVYIDTHTANDKWVFVSDALLRSQEENDNLGDTFYLKAAGRTLSLALAPRKSVTFEAKARKPFAPMNVHVEDDGTGELTITATRRNRTEETMVDLVLSPSTLDEDSEEYELEVYDGSTLVRTVTGLTSLSYVYTTANQTTDGFSPPLLTLRVKWYQISAVVGRGFARDVTADVEQP